MYKYYILELEDEPFVPQFEEPGEEGETLYRAKGFKSLVFDENGLKKLKPYISDQAREVGATEKGKNIGSDSAWLLMQRIINPSMPGAIPLSILKEALGITNPNITELDILKQYTYTDINTALTKHTDAVATAIKLLTDNGWLDKHDRQVIQKDQIDRLIAPQ